MQSAKNAGASTQAFALPHAFYFRRLLLFFRNNQFWFAKILLYYFFQKPLVLQVQVLPLFFLFDLCFQGVLENAFFFYRHKTTKVLLPLFLFQVFITIVLLLNFG